MIKMRKVVGSKPTLIRVFLCPRVGPFPFLRLILRWDNLAIYLALQLTPYNYLAHSRVDGQIRCENACTDADLFLSVFWNREVFENGGFRERISVNGASEKKKKITTKIQEDRNSLQFIHFDSLPSCGLLKT